MNDYNDIDEHVELSWDKEPEPEDRDESAQVEVEPQAAVSNAIVSLDDDWPYSSDEINHIAESLKPYLKISKYADRYCRAVEPVYSGSFTHRCTCPNLRHKGGRERSPSFYFSDNGGFFKCFGCSISGDVFDFLTIVVGGPYYDFVVGALKKNRLLLSTTGIIPILTTDISSYSFKLNLEISNEVRNFLKKRVGTPSYKEHLEWADHLFIRVDEAFKKFKDPLAVKSFQSQILMEIRRRELL